MSKPSFSNQDFTKHREGPKRELRLNEWYENLEAHRAAQKYFTGETVVPNNPNNQQSYVPKKSMHEPPSSSDADNVFYRNPYGDAEKVEQAQVPVLGKNPTQFGKYFSAPDPDPELDRPNFVQTPGPGSEMSQPRFSSGEKGKKSIMEIGAAMEKGFTAENRTRNMRARGTNTGFGGFGAGPQRSVEAKPERPRQSGGFKRDPNYKGSK